MAHIEEALRVITGQVDGDIREALASLDKVLANSSSGFHPQFVHFLERRSYVKALAFIVDGSTEE